MRTTFNINSEVLKALKLRSVETNESVSSIVENALVQQILEDIEDIEDAKKRENEPVYSFDDLVAEFKASGLL